MGHSPGMLRLTCVAGAILVVASAATAIVHKPASTPTPPNVAVPRPAESAQAARGAAPDSSPGAQPRPAKRPAAVSSAVATDSGTTPLPPGVGLSWWAAVQEGLAAREYLVASLPTADAAGETGVFRAPNRAQGFVTTFASRGIRVTPRAGGASAWHLALELAGVGPGGRVREVEGGIASAEGTRFRLERAGLEEWFVNRPDGLEHGFTIDAPPVGLSSDDSLAVELAVGGTLRAMIVEGGRAAELLQGNVRVLRYGGLEVRDASGTELRSHMETDRDGRRIHLVADVRGARWPVTVDPVLTTTGWRAEGDQGGASFGSSVASAGDVNGDGYDDVIVGAPDFDNGATSEGSAFVFHGSVAGLSSTPAWTAEGDLANAHFGSSVARAGDVNGDGYSDVIVGAYGHDNGATDEGRAYVFHGSATGLSATAAWTVESNQAGARLGESVATAGDVNGDGYSDVIVGAPRYDDGQSDEGRAYVYHGSASGLSISPSWTSNGDQAYAELGKSVATAGDVNGDGYADIVVGAYLFDNGESNEGRAWVYHGSVSGLLTSPSWFAESNQASAYFGLSVASAGDVNGDGFADVVVGASEYDHGEINEGRAFVFHGSAAGVSATAAWTAEANQAGAYFGRSLAGAGDVDGDGYDDVIVGADQYDTPEDAAGRVYVFHGSATGLRVDATWTGQSHVAADWLGYSAASAGDVNGDGYADVIVGAPYFDNGATNEGAAYVHLGSRGGIGAGVWLGGGDAPEQRTGYSVASAGDVNGDGYTDVIVGEIGYGNGEIGEGRALVYHGSPTGPSTTPSWSVEGNLTNAELGRAVASAGDVNGDGYADVIVGAPEYANGEATEGRVYVFHGSPSGLSATSNWNIEGNQVNAQLGSAVASAGDVNGDGYADVVVGAPYYDNGEANEGRAFVYHGSASGLAATAAWTAEGNQATALFGSSVAPAGDVNRDGYSDVVVGAPNYDNGETNEGRVFVYHGSATGLSATASRTLESDQAEAAFGYSVDTAGDVNGDGYADVIVGAYHYDNGQTDEGRAFVYHGSATGVAASATWTAEADQANAALGMSVACAGDVNGDGYADVVVGAPSYSGDQADEGSLWVYYGSASGLGATAAWTVESNTASAYFGGPVAAAGDVNGDGFGDLLVGAPFADGYAGRTYLFYGAASAPAATASWTAEINQADARFGRSVASAGDVNGDGYGDVIVGAPYADNGESNEGRAQVFLGSSTGLAATAAWTAESNLANSYFGFSVASAGDVNGDGYGDVIVGADTFTNGQTNEGRAFVYHGSATGLSATASWTAESDQASATFGHFVAAAGDVNGDGYGDVIVGAYHFDNGQSNEGRVYVYHGSATGLSTTPAWTAEGEQASAELGTWVGSAGDVNGDGYADVIVGAPGYDDPESNEGRVFVWYGGPSGVNAGVPGTPANAPWSGEGDQANAALGGSVATAGDVNGDGYADVVVGAYGADHPEVDEGRVFVWYGGPNGVNDGVDGTPENAAWSAEANRADAYFGYSVGTAGDVNGDGFADLVIGSPRLANGQALEGRVSVYLGSARGPLPAPTWTFESNQVNGYLSTSCASAGDVNGDGFADLIAGSDQYDNGETNEGRAFVFYGNGGTGRAVEAQQLPSSGTAPVQPWGSSGASNEVVIRSRHVSPFGRDRVKAEVEACPVGVPFGQPGCIVTSGASWISAGSPVQIVTNLAIPRVGSLYRWRVRTLRAPYRVTTAGITPPPNPPHGPWRRVLGQAVEADVRTGSKYRLSAVCFGTATGRVTSSPAGLDCTSSCSAVFDPNALVTLTATADSGSVFAGWYGACVGMGPCEVTMSNSTAVYATFNSPYSLTVAKYGPGDGVITSAPAGISCGGDCSETYAAGTPVTLTATPTAESRFAGWSGGGCVGLGTCQVQMNTAHHVWGVFVPAARPAAYYTVTPCRMLDTRVTSGAAGAAPVLAAESRREFPLVGKCGLPASARAISVNMTVVGGTSAGELRVTASHIPSTHTSVLAIPVSRARANNGILQLSLDGLQTISVANPTAGSVHFILDVTGYFE